MWDPDRYKTMMSLSPLLFILILEVLDRDIRQDEKITGVKIKIGAYKLNFFTDDLGFVSTNSPK